MKAAAVRRAALLAGVALLGAPGTVQGQAGGRKALNPRSLSHPRGYSHVIVTAAGRHVAISGQVSLDSLGNVVGAGDFRPQCVQVFENRGRALRSAGATFDDVVSTDMYVTDLGHLAILREVRARYLPAEPPASTLVQVVALVRPELMIEVSAEAVLPDAAGSAP